MMPDYGGCEVSMKGHERIFVHPRSIVYIHETIHPTKKIMTQLVLHGGERVYITESIREAELIVSRCLLEYYTVCPH